MLVTKEKVKVGYFLSSQCLSLVYEHIQTPSHLPGENAVLIQEAIANHKHFYDFHHSTRYLFILLSTHGLRNFLKVFTHDTARNRSLVQESRTLTAQPQTSISPYLYRKTTSVMQTILKRNGGNVDYNCTTAMQTLLCMRIT